MATARTRRPLGRPTINDVARAAGVSPMTVSRVINRDPGVRPATRERVEEAVAALDYAPSPAARRLAGGEETRIALVYANPSASYLSELLMGCLEGAAARNAHLSVEALDEAGEAAGVLARLVEQVRSGRIDGLVLPPPLCNAPPVLAALEAAHVPFVAVASGPRREGLAAVAIDDAAAAATMTRHLLARGHRRIGFIVGNPDQSASASRLEGHRAALAEAGVPDDPALVAPGDFTYRSGLAAATRLLDAVPPPSAIFASNDDMAAAALAVARSRGLAVPEDLTVVGFDDTPMAMTIWPELTTIRQPIRAMARTAVDMVIDRVRGGGDAALEHRMLDFELVQRGSDAAL